VSICLGLRLRPRPTDVGESHTFRVCNTCVKLTFLEVCASVWFCRFNKLFRFVGPRNSSPVGPANSINNLPSFITSKNLPCVFGCDIAALVLVSPLGVSKVSGKDWRRRSRGIRPRFKLVRYGIVSIHPSAVDLIEPAVNSKASCF